MRIEEVALDDDRAVAAWFEPIDLSDRLTWGEPGWSLGEARVLSEQRAIRSTLCVARNEDGTVAGSLWLRRPTRDNTHALEVHLAVHPANRRSGVGTALALHAEAFARAAGCTEISGERDEPVGGDDSSAATAFAEHLGYVAALGVARRALAVPIDEELLDGLAADCAPHSVGYALRGWLGRCPPELIEDRMALARSISTDAPLGALEREEEVWDRERFEEWEANAEKMGRLTIATGAVHEESGALVGVTEVSVPRDRPDPAYQWDTIVLPAHRGHRLGTLVKVANARQLAERSPATHRVVTWNARENAPMIRVNDALGFEVVGLGTTWRKVLA